MTRDEALRILGLESNATLDDAKRAYCDLVKVIHPDKDYSPGAKQRFILVQDAYQMITNADQQVQGEHGRAEKARRDREREQREAKVRAERERQEREAREQKERKRQANERAERKRQEKERANRERQEKEQRDIEAHVFSCLERGMEKIAKLKQYAAAINDFDNGLEVLEKLYPRHTPRYVHDVYYWRGLAKYFLIQYNGAAKLNQHLDVKLLEYKDVIQDFDMAIYLRPDYAGAYYWRGRAKYEESRSVGSVLGTFDDAVNAVQDFDMAIYLRPDYAGAYYWRGNAKFGLKQNDAACQDYEKANALVTEKKMMLDSWGESL